jgi:hypothetical protein
MASRRRPKKLRSSLVSACLGYLCKSRLANNDQLRISRSTSSTLKTQATSAWSAPTILPTSLLS